MEEILFDLLGRWRRGRKVLIIGILDVGHIRIAPELILVVGGFKQHWVAYLRMPRVLSPMTLKSFPHGGGLHETSVSSRNIDETSHSRLVASRIKVSPSSYSGSTTASSENQYIC